MDYQSRLDRRRQDSRSAAIDCGIAMGGVAIAVIVRQWLDRYLGAHQPFSTFYIAVFFAAWFGGWVPALVTLGLSALAADYCFMEPRRSLMLNTSEEIIGMLTFFFVGTSAILFSEANRAARERAEEIAEQLRLHESELQNEVTERRAAENSLRASEEKARRLIDSNVIGVIVFDADGQIEQANEAFVRMLGYTKSEFDHLSPKPTWRELTPAEFADRDENAVREMASRGRCDAYEKTFIKKDGMRVPVLFGGATFDAPLAGGTAFILDLSEIQRARQTLQLQSRVLESMTEGVVVVDMSHAKDDPPQAHVVFTNPAADAMYGYERNEMIGRSLADLSDLTGEERRDVIEEIELALRVRGNWSGELHGRQRRDGSTFVAEATVVRLRESPDVTGRPSETAPEFWICVQQDITARRHVEHAARASEERLELAMAAAEMGTWEIDLATGMLKASQQVRSLVDESTATARASHNGSSDDEIETADKVEPSTDPIPMETFYQRIHPDDRERVRQSVLDAIAGKLDYDVEFRGLRENGTTRWLHARAAVFHDDAGRPVRLTGFTLDVTASRAAAEAQRISEERFRLAADAVQSVIYDQDIKTNRTHRSSGLQRVLGFGAKPPGSELSPEDAVPSGDWWRSRIHRDDIARYEADRTSAITSGDSTFSCEYRMQHRDGHYVNVWDRAILVRDPQSTEVVRVVGSTMDISDRANAEARLRRLVDSNIIGVIFATPERVMQANDAYLQMVGYTRDDLEAGQVVWRNMTPPEYAHLDERAIAELRERGVCTPFEKEYLRKDGTRVPVLLGAAALDPQVSEWVCFAADLSERKRAAEALKQSEQRYRTFIAQSSEGVWRFEADPMPTDLPIDEQIDRFFTTAHLAECNDAMARMYGLESSEQLVGKRCDELLVREDPRNTEYLRAFIENGYRLTDAESVERDVHGRIRHFVNNLVGTIEDGKLVRAWGTQRDVTDRKQAEEALRYSEERFRQFAEASRDVLWIHNAKENRLEYVSPAFEQIWGRKREEILSEQGKWYQWLHDDDRERASSAMADVLTAGVVEIDYRIVHADGSVRWIHDSGFLIKDDSGTNTRVGGIATDITDRRAAEDDLFKAKEAAENADRAKDQFLAVLSHELRTPLTPVLGVVQILGRDPTVPPHVREELEMIHRNIDLEARLIDDLLDLTRVARGKIDLHVQPCDVHDSMRRAAEICKPALDEKHLSVRLELAAERPVVSGDPARLQQVLWNLVKNAVKFTPSGGGEIVIHTHNETAEHDGAPRDTLVLKVFDHGIGIEPEAMQRIFNAFEQGTRAVDGRYGGLGLGLSISKTLVDLHGGHLHAESEGPGKGATFVLRLPTTTSEVPRARRDDTPPAQPIEDAQPGSELRILLVEDHEDTARVMSRVLRQMKYHVTTAGDVASALHLASNDTFDLVISDLGLPDGSGLDLMRQLLEENKEAGVKAIALSGYGMEADRERCREAGFMEHLTKPVDLQRLSETIQRVALSDRS